MRLTVTLDGKTEADVYVSEANVTDAFRCATAMGPEPDDNEHWLRCLAMISKPWEGRRQGHPIIKHRDGTIEFQPANQHIKVDVSLDLRALHEAIEEHRLAVESLDIEVPAETVEALHEEV